MPASKITTSMQAFFIFPLPYCVATWFLTLHSSSLYLASPPQTNANKWPYLFQD